MSDNSNNERIKGKWVVINTIVGGVIGYLTATKINSVPSANPLNESQLCISKYTPSNNKAIEAEIFVEHTNIKRYAKWDEQSVAEDYIANGMSRSDAEAKAEKEFAAFNERPQVLKKFIENNQEILLSELQDVNKAFTSDCMIPYERILKEIYDNERMSR